MSNINILTFVGNGFDISVLQKFQAPQTTTYQDFYYDFINKYPNRTSNILIQKMNSARQNGEPDWSDFEWQLNKELKTYGENDKERVKHLLSDLKEIQRAFSHYLNAIITPTFIDTFSDYVVENQSAKNTFKYFLGDLPSRSYENMAFHSKIGNNCNVNFTFFNFNYTLLLDNYIFLSRDYFDPEPFSTSTNNFTMMTNPNDYPGHRNYPDPVCRINSKVIHPHGMQGVPYTMLFGTEVQQRHHYKFLPKDCRRIFAKSYWGQLEANYYNSFNDIDLFIIFGCSMGKTDCWWWYNIFEKLVSSDSELIIYSYNTYSDDEVISHFTESCNLKNSFDEAEKNKAKSKIFVVHYNSNTPVKFLHV